MSMTDTTTPTKVRWWSSWKSLQTAAFILGWAAGVPAGALGALAWGVWSNQATYASMEAKYVLAVASSTALDTRVSAIEKTIEPWNTRITKLETEVGPRVITSELLDRYGAHINALDGRADTTDRNINTMRDALQAQLTGLCVEIRGIGASSARKNKGCP